MVEISRPPNLDELRDRLAIPTINTGRQIHLFGQPAGLVTDDLEGLHAIADENGYIRLISGTEFSMQMYRGQTQVYPRCVPTLSRLEGTSKNPHFVAPAQAGAQGTTRCARDSGRLPAQEHGAGQ